MEAPDDLPLHESIRPAAGVHIERRGFFATVAGAIVAAQLPGTHRGLRSLSMRADATDPLGIAEFVELALPICRELLADDSARGQDRYLLTLASLAVRLSDVPVPEQREVGPGHRIGSNHGPDPFTVLHWTLEPGASIAPHAHAYGNVVTLGLAGLARISNFEVLGERDYDSEKSIVVRQTVEQFLRAGDVNLVSLERNYVHGFVAGPDGARGLDITTRIRSKRSTPQLELGAPIDAAAGTFEASWHLG